MNNDLALLEQLNTLISKEELDEWKEMSNDVIAEGEVEPLSLLGACAAAKNIAYIMVTDALHTADAILAHEHVDLEVLPQRMQALPDIHFTTCIASGVHPTILSGLIDLYADKYSDEIILSRMV